MHDIDPVIILLTLYLVGFASLATALFLFKPGIRWGGRAGAGKVPMSRRSRACFALTAWMLPLFVLTGTLKYRISGAFGLGFFVFFLATMISGIADAYGFKRSRKAGLEDEDPNTFTHPS